MPCRTPWSRPCACGRTTRRGTPRAGWSPLPGVSSSTPAAPIPPGGTARYASRASPSPAPARRWTTRSRCTSCARTRPLHPPRPARSRCRRPAAGRARGRRTPALPAGGVDGLRAALPRDRLGEFQAQAAIAALHADARTAAETDWTQIVEWYDELVRLTGNPVARLNRAVAVGEADGPQAGLAALAALHPSLPRHAAVAACLHDRDG